MANSPASAMLRYIRRLIITPEVGGRSDAHLLRQFVQHRDEEAFTALMQRHGPLVLSVCRRILVQEQDAEDAFQATFLVLARKAGSIARGDSVGSWLYGVALRIAGKIRGGIRRRRQRETSLQEVSSLDPTPEWVWEEIQPVLDEEVSRLPPPYRSAFVLCHLQGKSSAEAATELGCRPGTIFSRLARARALLRDRLARRGLALSTGLLTALFTENPAQAAVPSSLAGATVRGALQFVVGEGAAGLVSARALALAKGAMKQMFLDKLRIWSVVLLLGTVGVTGAGIWTYHAMAGPRDSQAKNVTEPAKDNSGLTGLVRVPSRKDGIILVIGTEIATGEKVPPEQIIGVTAPTLEERPPQLRRIRRGDRVEEGQLLAIVDDPLAVSDVVIKQAKLAAAMADRIATEKTRDEAKKRYETAEKLYHQSKVSLEDIRSAELTWMRFVYEEKSKVEGIKIAQSELQQAKTAFKMGEIRSPCKGIIQKICFRRGEGVHALEPVIIIQVPDESD
jgi:RNA polymerase sigma factor (sigma-70 family)